MTTPALRVAEHHLLVQRRFLRSGLTMSFVTPMLFLAAMGIGLGSLIDDGSTTASLGGLSCLEFVGPGLLAAATMQVAAGDSMWPIMGGLKWQKTWHAILAAPISVRDIVNGQFIYQALKLVPGAVAYLFALALFGVPDSPRSVLAVPAAVLTAMAFATPITAFAATQENEMGFLVVFRLGIMPLFLFSGTFFPIEQLPDALETIAVVTPLWHGVELVRGLIVGGIEASKAAGHVAYLLVWVGTGWVVAFATFRRRLVA
jgi:lipooligosaccharide transport system permease protein